MLKTSFTPVDLTRRWTNYHSRIRRAVESGFSACRTGRCTEEALCTVNVAEYWPSLRGPAGVRRSICHRSAPGDHDESEGATLPVDNRVGDRASSSDGPVPGKLTCATTASVRTRRPVIAIAHDYLTQRGGAERVVVALRSAFPDATVYTTLFDPAGTFPEFADMPVVTSILNRSRLLRRHHRLAMPLLAVISSHMHIDADVLVVSSSGWAHGFKCTGRKLVYCHSPARWVYRTSDYVGGKPAGSVKGLVALALRPVLRRWDQVAAHSADRYLVNSRLVRDRVRAAYGIDADVLPPPTSMDPGGPMAAVPELEEWESGFRLTVSRLLPYKNVSAVVEAFRGLDEKLAVIGDGPLHSRLGQRLPANVRLIRQVDDAQLRWAYGHCTGLIAASHEDFGLTPVEAGMFGKPTIALRAGGYLDTVEEGVNGVFFDAPAPQEIRSAVRKARSVHWDGEAIRAHADRFARQRFCDRLVAEVEALLDE